MHNTNSLKDEVLLQHKKLKDQSFSKKLEYFWGYYKIPFIMILCALYIFGSIFYAMITQKETVLSIACINASLDFDSESAADEFENYLGINTKKQQVIIDSNYYINNNSSYIDTYNQKFSTNAMSDLLDVVLADQSVFEYYGEQGVFQNLSTILSDEELEYFKNNLYYVDLPYDELNQKVPVGIKITYPEKIGYLNTIAYFGIALDTHHVESALSYLWYLENK